MFDISYDAFKVSPEYEDWIQETGGRDEDEDYYYQKFKERVQASYKYKKQY